MHPFLNVHHDWIGHYFMDFVGGMVFIYGKTRNLINWFRFVNDLNSSIKISIGWYFGRHEGFSRRNRVSDSDKKPK